MHITDRWKGSFSNLLQQSVLTFWLVLLHYIPPQQRDVYESSQIHQSHSEILLIKKHGRRGEWTPLFFIKRKQHGFSRPRKNPRILAHAREGQALRRAQRGDFFTHGRKFVPTRIRTRDLVGTTIPQLL